ncbi:6899_t:CDS:2 [Acaulospora colombiana]|uniref:6899_t:CDS:1 n=1 Tax=Acaulospora colombiana TaxID=27376 RepID=A0ACA9LNS2_9GLOM|nr:6899_t:CDS:2 [Acaulospora colombiana]
MTKEKFMKDGMKKLSAIKLENQAKVFKRGHIGYFWLFPCDVWSIQHFISWSTNMFGPVERNVAHTIFYNTLYILRDDSETSKEILEVVRNLLHEKKALGYCSTLA